MAEYDIRKAVKAVMDGSDLASPEEIATKVAEGVPPRNLRSVLATVLRVYVRVELGRERMATSPRQAPEAKAPVKANRSAKVAAIREAAPRWLRDRVFVGTQWLLLGDCSYVHLKFLESERTANASRSAAAAARYGHLAELVKQYHVSRVADLPRAVLDAESKRVVVA
jgi:hypothetical protein